MPRYTKKDVEDAVLAIEEGETYNEVSERFCIPKSTLHNKVHRYHEGKRGRALALGDDFEQKLVVALNTLARWRVPLQKSEVCSLVKRYLDMSQIDIPQFKDNIPGESWLNAFIIRRKLSKRIPDMIRPVRAKITPTIINEYFDQLQQTLAGIDPANIYNYDETYLADDPGAKCVLVSSGFGRVERQQENSKLRYSVMFGVNGIGKMTAPMVIYRAQNLYEEWTVDGPSGTVYAVTKSGWFDMDTFTTWYFEVFLHHVRDVTQPMVLIGDNLASHFSPERGGILGLPSNATHLCQPLDVGVFRGMKQRWRQILTKWRIENPTGTLPKTEFPGLLRELCLSANEESAISSFRATGFFPLDRQHVLKRLPSKEKNDAQVKRVLSEAVLETLAVNVGIGKEQEQKAKRRCRPSRKIIPGKRITTDQLEKEVVQIISVADDEEWFCCRCAMKWVFDSDDEWIVCNTRDKTYHLQCSGYQYDKEDYSKIDIDNVDYGCCT